MSWKARLNVALGKRPWRIVKLEHDSDGLNVKVDDARTGRGEHSIRWQNVESAIAYKLDAVTYDIIVVRFTTATGTVDVMEDAEGWAGLLEALPNYLPGFLPIQDIFEAVALPPFATKATNVYKRAR